MAKPYIVACVNLKGGVGKTAIAVNFAAYCAYKGMRTLLVDLDPQTNATFSCISVDDWEAHAANNGTIADLFGARAHTSAEGKQRDVSTVSRTWRWVDIQTIANPEPYDFRITGYREIADFDLKQPLPRAVFEKLWDRL